jgi:hypothetical protein
MNGGFSPSLTAGVVEPINAAFHTNDRIVLCFWGPSCATLAKAWSLTRDDSNTPEKCIEELRKMPGLTQEWGTAVRILLDTPEVNFQRIVDIIQQAYEELVVWSRTAPSTK